MNMTHFTDNAINASPERMSEQAELIKESCLRIILGVENISRYIEQVSCYWDTEGSEALREIFSTDTGEAQTIEKRLKNRINDLNSIIINYQSTEKTTLQDASTLPDSIFS